MEQYLQSLQRASILADFELLLREAVRADAAARIEALTARYLDRYGWLADDFYRKRASARMSDCWPGTIPRRCAISPRSGATSATRRAPPSASWRRR